MKRGLFVFPLVLAAFALVKVSLADVESEQCPAEKYKPCTSFTTSVEIGEHEPIIDNHVAGFTRSKGAWRIRVRYRPDTECARVNFLLDMGPLDAHRQYRKVFKNGGGVISDSGTFMHRMDDLGTALRIPSIACFVPDQGVSEEDADADDGETRADEQERLALEEERERLALEREREQLELEEERERLALERERLALEQELAEGERRRRQQKERERRRRLAEQQRQQQHPRERPPQQKTEMEIALDSLMAEYRAALERKTRQEAVERRKIRQEREAKEQADTDTLMTGLTLGLIGGALGALAGEGGSSFDTGALAMLPTRGGPGCERIERRLARDLEAVNRLHGDSMCGMGRGMAQALTRARNEMAAMNCSGNAEPAEMDRSIRQAQAMARASCGGN